MDIVSPLLEELYLYMIVNLDTDIIWNVPQRKSGNLSPYEQLEANPMICSVNCGL